MERRGSEPDDYDFLGQPDAPNEPEVEVSYIDELLIQAGRQLGVLSLRTGSMNPILQRAAQDHARFQADDGRMGHQNWGQRSGRLFAELPELTGFREVAAYSGHAANRAASSVFESWRQSPAHWVWVNGHCDFWGYGMALNPSTNLWYACGIFADRKIDRR